MSLTYTRPTLIPELVALINANVQDRYAGSNSSSAMILRRSLEVLNAILKELANVKLPSGIKTMGGVRFIIS